MKLRPYNVESKQLQWNQWKLTTNGREKSIKWSKIIWRDRENKRIFHVSRMHEDGMFKLMMERPAGIKESKISEGGDWRAVVVTCQQAAPVHDDINSGDPCQFQRLYKANRVNSSEMHCCTWPISFLTHDLTQDTANISPHYLFRYCETWTTRCRDPEIWNLWRRRHGHSSLCPTQSVFLRSNSIPCHIEVKPKMLSI
jgi:hypothetical protein